MERNYDDKFKNVFEAIKLLLDKTTRIEHNQIIEQKKPPRKYGFLADRK